MWWQNRYSEQRMAFLALFLSFLKGHYLSVFMLAHTCHTQKVGLRKLTATTVYTWTIT